MANIPINWDDYPNFRREEFIDHENGECDMQPDFMAALQQIRDKYDMPMIISSGYRSPSNPIERVKPILGEHTMGMAADILVAGRNALILVEIALSNGIKRIGVSQKGDVGSRFIHLGIGDRLKLFPVSIWSY